MSGSLNVTQWKLEFKGDLYEDKDDLSILSKSMEMYAAIIDIKAEIRKRTKYSEISDDEDKFLDQLCDLLRGFE